jgi:hypothetical protein
MAGGGLEGPQRAERRQLGHRAVSSSGLHPGTGVAGGRISMNKTNPNDEQWSFVGKPDVTDIRTT